MRKIRRKNKSRKRLEVASAGVLPTHVPKRWVKCVVGVFLLVPCAVLAQTFFTVLAETTMRGGFWQHEAFWFFALGGIVWLGAFVGGFRLMWLYVFGHELTHALWVMVQGGRVHRFHVSSDGGHIIADKTNTWIALAPYFFPIYSVLVLIAYGICGLYIEIPPWGRWVAFGALGFTWAHHMTLSWLVIQKGQPDLRYGGAFFSLVVIAILNLALLSALLIVASPDITFRGFIRQFLENARDATVALTFLVNRPFR